MNKSKSKLIKKLCDIVRFDIDAEWAYEQALSHIEDDAIYKNFILLRNDHRRHIEVLSEQIKLLGGRPPKKCEEFEDYCIKTFTTLRGVLGTDGALKAMKENEEHAYKIYQNALSDTIMPLEIRNIIMKNYMDEKNHIQYIINALKSFSDINSKIF